MLVTSTVLCGITVARAFGRFLSHGTQKELPFVHPVDSNSHRVVRLLYGPSYGLTIESSPGNGTRVSVTLPADMEEDTYV